MDIHWQPQRGAASAELIGDSPAIVALRALIDRVAPTDASVLVTGPSGSGKEVVAQRLHQRGDRAAGPFVAINCAAIPRDLLESELFGHEAGAFTGAGRAAPGRFEAANGGTLLLDEIGELPAALQAKLLRVLETRRLSRLGARSEIAIDVRVVAATNADLGAAIADGRFREDLYYRLAVVEIALPALADRRDDIPALVAHLAARLPAGRRCGRFTADALATLETLPWRGNIRELRNLVERAATLFPGEPIDAARVATLTAGRRPPDLEAPFAPVASPTGAPIDLKALLARIEHDLIVDALGRHGGEVAGAARTLGLNRTTLLEKMRRLGVRRGAAQAAMAVSAASVAAMVPPPSTRVPA